MKKFLAFLLFSLPLMALASCGAAVKNPPKFVEMYLQQEESSLMSQTRNRSSPMQAEGDYDEIIYSHSDFHIAVITNGVNYDLLYSVELNDSLLGSCVYTNQSLAYKADATIIVEPNNTYTTEIILTIPGSTDHATYLSDRTITLSKILFSRDTVDGTFPADIPSNTDTVLAFEVHAVNYMDADLGFPVVMNNGYIDVILRPGSPEYTLAVGANKTALTIPETINGYPVRSIFLETLTWVQHLTIQGASESVFIIGDFQALVTLSISHVWHELESLNPTFKELALTALFPVLETLTFSHCNGYRLYLSYNSDSLNADYEAYAGDKLASPYSFTSLKEITIDDCMFADVYVAGDRYNVGFPALETITITDCNIGTLWFGDDGTMFGALNMLSCDNCHFSSMYIEGTRLETLPAAILDLTNGSYGHMEIKGNLWGDLSLAEITIGSLLITHVLYKYVQMTSVQLSHITFNGTNPGLRLVGYFPLLQTIALNHVTNGTISIGDVGSEFDSLTSIALSHVSGSGLNIGERSAIFPELTTIDIADCVFTNNMRFGYENSEYASLESIMIQNTTAANFTVGFVNDLFGALKLIYLADVTLTGGISIQGITSSAMQAFVCQNVVVSTMNVTIVCTGYDFYFAGTTISSSFYISDSCKRIFVTNNPATSWPYYARATELGIPVYTGTYNPS